MNEDELAKQLKKFQELGKGNKDIDVAALSLAALQGYEKNLLPAKQKRWGYLVSLAVPPFGLIYAFRFYFSGKEDGEEAALLCVVLTCVSIILFVLLGKLMLSSGGITPSQIQQIKPSDVQQLYQ